ncbi:hypothetical protein WJX75_005646 [Coccomyxa subellipsoidea]|uniref:UspA domain-containing protein n=1 Tax=Coccomyxa subellipsoidea TaxID=248742 RepID=A0ABR2Z0T0_9CHLO
MDEDEGRNLLVPVDDAEDCERALQWCLDNVYRKGDTIHLLHVVPHAHNSSFSHLDEHQDEMLAEQARGFIEDRFLRSLEASRVPYHVCIVRGETDTESVGQLICQKADELRASLVAMAAHNKGRLVRFIVGSTTRYCIRHSHVTVLVMQNN